MGDPLAAVLTLLLLAFVVWIKIVRPVRGDLEWSRQGERVRQARARRLARHQEPVVPGPKST